MGRARRGRGPEREKMCLQTVGMSASRGLESNLGCTAQKLNRNGLQLVVMMHPAETGMQRPMRGGKRCSVTGR